MTDLPRYEYVKLADAIATEIASGKLPQGAALPGERAMTELYGVSIGTVRRAIVELRNRGLVATLPAKGTYVIAQPDAPANSNGTAD
ncbi:winged helix-turn-helix domain-containing protein [Streptomyces sp. R1]|uniref:GntR family transcriptional regulator n=1 Tax=Streptomyces sp. R1 TaxID=1509279 RepID=UPI001E3FD9F4|nr:winged helix-turn-helix domain-containing protein [Streptomyces sp. R1]MCC8334733.1 winged helix-turn-helix domain-containing protein [Streptomyces sp. R1]